MTLRVLRSAFVACLFCSALDLGWAAAGVLTIALIVASSSVRNR